MTSDGSARSPFPGPFAVRASRSAARVFAVGAMASLACSASGCAPAPTSPASAASQGGAPWASGEASRDASGVATTLRTNASELRTMSLAGDWKYLPYDGEGNMGAESLDDGNWPQMHLPSSWYLMGKKEYPAKASAQPRTFGNNMPGELWPVDPEFGLDHSGTVWFRRGVEWAGDGKTPVVLDLDMVDYYAEVFVNGTSVGHHEGYFQKFSIDVSKALRKGRNVVAVKVSAPALAFDMSQQYPVSFPKMQNQIKGIFAYHDTRPGATSWRGQERSTGGILAGITLRESSGVDIEHLSVVPMDVTQASARLVVEAVVHNWTSSPVRTTLRGEITPKNFEAATKIPVALEIEAKPGVSEARVEVKIDKPELWWSWDQGKPNLYKLEGELHSGSAKVATKTATFGVRSIAKDKGFVYVLNGRRVYPRGSNYISTQWLSQADRAFYERDVKLMVGANLNAIRVHAHLERPEFYDVADEMGVMVWQDFPLQWGYTDLPSFHDEARRQAADMIRQYKNHPSITLWAMHNEAPYAMDWMKKKDAKQNLALDESLVALATKQDPSRIAHRDSGTGDGHYYYGWYDGKAGDLASLAKVDPMVTEYGASALPSVETLTKMFDAKTLFPKEPKEWETWQFADFQPNNTFKLAGIKQGKNIQEFVDNTQRYQASLVRFQTEVFRRRKWNGNTGVYHFMFTEDWPSITWAVVDYYRRPKLGYAALRDSMQRMLPSIEYDIHDPQKPVSLHIVNDYPEAFPGAKLTWQVVEPGGAKSKESSKTVDIPADSAQKVVDAFALAKSVASGAARLEVTISAADGKVLGKSSLDAKDFLLRTAR